MGKGKARKAQKPVEKKSDTRPLVDAVAKAIISHFGLDPEVNKMADLKPEQIQLAYRVLKSGADICFIMGGLASGVQL